MAEIQKISVAEWFYRNKEVAGFDNPSRAIYMIAREAVENSLDSCEDIMVKPKIVLSFDSRKEGAIAFRTKDNGAGVPADSIPIAFGSMFTSSKYRLKQSRGLFGMGMKIAILYSQTKMNQPFTVVSAHKGVGATYVMKLNIENDVPEILDKRIVNVSPNAHGLALNLTTAGDLRVGQIHIKSYLELTAMACPYADIALSINGTEYRYPSQFESVPKPSQELNPHPSGLDIEIMKRLVVNSPNLTLREYLIENFQRVNDSKADEFIMAHRLKPAAIVGRLTANQLIQLQGLIVSWGNWFPPDIACLSPIGASAMEAGAGRSERVKFGSYSWAKGVYNAQPYIIEVYVARKESGPFKLVRIANRIPLLFDAGADLTMGVIDEEINWPHYGLPRDRKELPILVMFHLASTRVPFKTAGKEFIADVPEMRKDFKSCLQSGLRSIQEYEEGKRKEADLAHIRDAYTTYIPLFYKFCLKGLKQQPQRQVGKEIGSWMD